MDPESIALVRRIYDHWARGDFVTMGDAFDPEIEFDRIGPDITGDLGGPFHGRAEFAKATRAWLSAWERFSIEIDRVIDLGDHLVVLTRWGGHGRDSGVPIEREGADLWRVRDGRVVELRMWYHRHEGLSALGVEP